MTEISKLPPNGGDSVNLDNLDVLDLDNVIINEEYLENAIKSKISIDGNEEWEIVQNIKNIITYRQIKSVPEKQKANYHNTRMVDYVMDTISPSWYNIVHQGYMSLEEISSGLWTVAHRNKQRIVPSLRNLMNSLNYCPFESVKIIILGQGPYRWIDGGREVANGFSFSAEKVENSLKNIYKELERSYPGSEDLDKGERFIAPNHGNLKSWAKQGVLLLNATFTGIGSERGGVYSRGEEEHKGRWNSFLSVVLSNLTKYHKNLIFFAWGQDAQKTLNNIGLIGKHTILKCAHPSGLAGGAKDKFAGCGHFIEANQILVKNNKQTPINWHSVMKKENN